jgi:hypothetical protein
MVACQPCTFLPDFLAIRQLAICQFGDRGQQLPIRLSWPTHLDLYKPWCFANLAIQTRCK